MHRFVSIPLFALSCVVASFPLHTTQAESQSQAESDQRSSSTEQGPKPGDLYREFSLHNAGDRDWRVTDVRAADKFPAAKKFLPNPKWQLEVSDLEHATRAEVLLDRWGGHVGTVNKRIRFNGNRWIRIPEIRVDRDDLRGEHVMYQDNPVVSVPLDHLRSGYNLLEANCDEQGGFGWGQWGLYSAVLRVYYDTKAKGEAFEMTGRILSPSSQSTIDDHPQIRVEAHAPMGVARVDLLACYDGYDIDGDGQFYEYHESHFQPARGQANSIRDHVATLWRQPYEVAWDTQWVPDQAPGSISLVARIQDARGYWFVTEPVEQLTLSRPDCRVKLYRARGVGEDFSVRAGETKHCTFEIPASDNVQSASEVALHLRTWHGWDGHHDPLRINDHAMAIDGKNHFYDYDLLPFPANVLISGENRFTMHSDTEHHMLEVLWPGPAIVVRMPKPEVAIRSDNYQDREHFVIETRSATYWLDKRSGGLSRLIDRQGNDWIRFKRQPWDKYPSSAGSSYRGLPNLLFGGSESGFGHPGWDVATSEQIDDRTILSTSESGTWKLRWTFDETGARLDVETSDDSREYWFLYEGPIAGRWAPDQQYFATDTSPPQHNPRDYQQGQRYQDAIRWAYLGDRNTERVLALVHLTADQQVDTFSHLGNSSEGLAAADGMVVFGFGRGPKGIDPKLRGDHSFRISLIESAGETDTQYDAIASQLNSSQLNDRTKSD